MNDTHSTVQKVPPLFPDGRNTSEGPAPAPQPQGAAPSAQDAERAPINDADGTTTTPATEPTQEKGLNAELAMERT